MASSSAASAVACFRNGHIRATGWSRRWDAHQQDDADRYARRNGITPHQIEEEEGDQDRDRLLRPSQQSNDHGDEDCHLNRQIGEAEK